MAQRKNLYKEHIFFETLASYYKTKQAIEEHRLKREKIMTEVDVHKWNIELFGSKEELKKEIEVLLEHSRTQMKLGG